MALLCSLPNSWDNLVMTIISIVKKLVLDEVMDTLLSKELRRKAYKSSNEALVVCGRSNEKTKNKEKGRYKSRGRPKSPRKFKEKCWNYGKVGHFKGDYKEEKNKNKKENNDSEDEFEKSSKEDRGDAFVVALETQAR